jgi:predicted kinase
MIKQPILVDVDGTVVDCSHRLHYIKNGNRNWPAFWAAIPLDTPINHVIRMVQAMKAAGHPIFVVTARDDDRKAVTEAQLLQHGVPFDRMYMRKTGDNRPDHVVKKELLDQIRAEGYDPLFMLEDRQHNVDMFRENGMPCFHVADDEDKPAERNWEGEHFLTMLIGPAGCGKSTLCAKMFEPSTIVSSDEIREMITVWDRLQKPEETWAMLTDADHARVWRAMHELVGVRLRNGLNTVVDATNLRRRDRMAFVKLVPPTQGIDYVILDRPLEDKLKTRGWRSEELVRKMHETFGASVKDALRGDDQPNVRVFDYRRAA